MDKAEHHRAYEHRHTVGHGAEQIPKLAPALGLAEYFAQLRERIAEEAAGKCAHDEGRYSGPQQELAERQRTCPGSYLLHCDDCRDYHQKAVAHVRHHQSVKQDKERRHQRIGVNSVVRRQAVHIRDHVKSVCYFIVCELYRNVGILIRLGVGQLPCAVVLFKAVLKLGYLLGKRPALQDDSTLHAVHPVLRLGAGDLRVQAVGSQLKLFPVYALVADLAGEAELFLRKPGKLAFHALCALLSRAVHAAEAGGGKAEFSKAVQRRGKLLFKADEHKIVLILIRVYEHELGFLRRCVQRRLGAADVNRRRNSSKHDRAALRAGTFKRIVEAQPRRERLDLAAHTAFLGRYAADALITADYLPGKLHGLRQRTVVKDSLAVGLGLCREQRLLSRCILLQQLDRLSELGVACPVPQKLAAFF